MNYSGLSIARRLAILVIVMLASGCAAVKTFHQTARAGDTVAIATGWQENWSRDNISVWVQDNGGSWVQYPANDPRIRAVVNFYPDPLSSMVVSNRTGQDVTPFAQNYANNVTNVFTSGSRDWFNTVVFFDLPTTMNLGTAHVYVEEVADPNNYVDTTVDIVENVSGGKVHDFQAQAAGTLQRQHLASLERSSHYAINLSGSGQIPHAVQLDFSHDTGVGKAYVVEPMSGIKNIIWHDDGTNLRVIIMPADGVTLADFEDFKFYVAGGVANLVATGTQAFDINGAAVAGVSSPSITEHDIAISTN